MDTSQRLIIGIDPGSRITGYGIILVKGSLQSHISHGHIRCQQTHLCERLYHIYEKLAGIITEYQPNEAAIEQVFTCHNHQSALKLGQARGAAMVAVARYALPLGEYSARQVKQAVVGYGAADKLQVQHMVRAILKLTKTPPADAADALAIALCHANTRQSHAMIASALATK
jgi:crossover junction endodeoxyribonuclease RuvC